VVDTQGKLGGIGVIVSGEKGKLIVDSALEGTPAERAGIKKGDEIVEVNGQLVEDLKGKALEQMRGAPGTTLLLKIRREGVKNLMDFKLVREVIKVVSVQDYQLAEGVHYFRISSFQEN